MAYSEEYFCLKEETVRKDRLAERAGKIKLQNADFARKNVRSVENLLRSMGFINIELINLHDLATGWISRPDTVESVTIGGKPAEINKWYFHNDPVVISYHDYGG